MLGQPGQCCNSKQPHNLRFKAAELMGQMLALIHVIPIKTQPAGASSIWNSAGSSKGNMTSHALARKVLHPPLSTFHWPKHS